jgi:hypothetical protein
VTAGVSLAGTFVNGGFEDGTFNGWTQGEGTWFGGGYPLSGSDYLPGGGSYNPAAPGDWVITNPGADPLTGGNLNMVYAGAHSARVNNSVNDFGVSVISQTVLNYTDADLFFEWAAVLQESHGSTDSDHFSLELKDLTTGLTILNRAYNSADNGPIFGVHFDPFWGDIFYTTTWQVEHIDIAGNGLTGHDLQLTLLASDCPYGGHWGYAYLDGFAGIIVPPAPEPGAYALLLFGGGLLGLFRFRRKNS